MAMLETNNTATAASNFLAPATANGPAVFTFSGTLGPRKKLPIITIQSRSDTADYTAVHSQSGFGRFQIDFVAGDSYVYIIENPDGASIDLAVVDV